MENLYKRHTLVGAYQNQMFLEEQLYRSHLETRLDMPIKFPAKLTHIYLFHAKNKKLDPKILL